MVKKHAMMEENKEHKENNQGYSVDELLKKIVSLQDIIEDKNNIISKLMKREMKINTAMDANVGEMEKLEKKHEKEFARLEKKHQNEMEEMEERHESEVDALVEEHELKIQILEKQYCVFDEE